MPIELIEQPGLSKVAVYNPIEAGIALLLDKHGHVLKTPPDVSTAKALALTKTNKQELVKFRTRIEAARKQEKADSLAYGRLVDSEAARITAIAAPLEAAYENAITAEEERIAAIERAKAEAERVRVTEIHNRIVAIRAFVGLALECRTSAMVESLIDKLCEMSAEGFDEFAEEAEQARAATNTRLKEISDAKFLEEKERARVKAEQEATAKAQQEQSRALAAQAEENARVAAANKAAADKIEADRAELERQRIAALPKPEPVIVQACRPEDRAMLETPAGQALVARAEEILRNDPAPALRVVPTAPNRPTDLAIVAAVAKAFDVSEPRALSWLIDFDVEATISAYEPATA